MRSRTPDILAAKSTCEKYRDRVKVNSELCPRGFGARLPLRRFSAGGRQVRRAGPLGFSLTLAQSGAKPPRSKTFGGLGVRAWGKSGVTNGRWRFTISAMQYWVVKQEPEAYSWAVF